MDQKKKCHFVVIGKRPIKGFSKTRLAKDIGDDLALQFYEAFIKDFFYGMKNWREGNSEFDHQLHFFGTPEEDKTKTYFEEIFKNVGLSEVNFSFQEEVPFFDRLKGIFKNHFERDSFLHLTGTDIPDFPFEYIEEIYSQDADIYIGPDDDYGFYYLGAKAGHFEVFEIQNHLDQGHGVKESIHLQAEVLGLKVHELENWSDVDCLEDLRKSFGRTTESKIPFTASKISECLE
jgi:glycosyltransferase A (GT-A) superfamily protein (DUF2064 family)